MNFWKNIEILKKNGKMFFSIENKENQLTFHKI